MKEILDKVDEKVYNIYKSQLRPTLQSNDNLMTLCKVKEIEKGLENAHK